MEWATKRSNRGLGGKGTPNSCLGHMRLIPQPVSDFGFRKRSLARKIYKHFFLQAFFTNIFQNAFLTTEIHFLLLTKFLRQLTRFASAYR